MNEVERARAENGEILQRTLEGQISFIESARRVNGLVEAAGFDRLSEPFVTFVAIDSQTDEIPLGNVRELWHPDAVEKHGAEWDRAEAWAKQFGEKGCRDGLALAQAG